MKTHDFWYDLPEELIAQTPLERRDGSRLMVLNRETGEIQHKHFYDIIDYLNPGDCLVMNDSRVLPARLMGHRPTGGVVEVLLLRDLGNKCWECLCKPGRKMQVMQKVRIQLYVQALKHFVQLSAKLRKLSLQESLLQNQQLSAVIQWNVSKYPVRLM